MRFGLALSALTIASFGIGGAAIGSDGNEFACEEAVAHLVDCCPGFDTRQVSCDQELFGGCDGSAPSGPEIGAYAAHCLRTLSCSQVQSKGFCNATTNWETAQCP